MVKWVQNSLWRPTYMTHSSAADSMHISSYNCCKGQLDVLDISLTARPCHVHATAIVILTAVVSLASCYQCRSHRWQSKSDQPVDGTITVIISPVPTLSQLTTQEPVCYFNATRPPNHIILISARWSVNSFCFFTGHVSLPCNIQLCTQLVYNLNSGFWTVIWYIENVLASVFWCCWMDDMNSISPVQNLLHKSQWFTFERVNWWLSTLILLRTIE